MRVGRLILVVATLVTIVLFPLLLRDALRTLQLPNAYAAPAGIDPNGRVYKDGNNNDNNNNKNKNNNNNNSDDDDDQNNDNEECFASLNDNEPVPCDNTNGNANDNGNANNNTTYTPPPPPPSGPPAPPAPTGPQQSARRCFSAGETGYLRLELIGGTITVHVVPPSGFSQDTSIRLDAVDPATVPAPTGGATILDTLVWRMSAGNPCDGPSISQLPTDVNLGVPYTVPANKAKLQIVYLQNNAWTEIPTSADPDPNKPYTSATVHNTGTYAVIQKP